MMEEGLKVPVKPGVLVGGPNPLEEKTKRPLGRGRRFLHAIGAPLLLVLLRMAWASYRFDVKGDDELRELVAAGKPFILLFWHGEIFPGAWMLERLSRMGARITYVISPSRDGEFALKMVQRVGGHAVRGSATRSGVKALKGLYRAITREKASPVILPDGPRGPRRVCKEGVLLLSQLTGVPVVPMAITARPAIRLKTWDRMLLPVPFSRVRFRVGPSFVVPREEPVEILRNRLPRLDQELVELEKAGD